LKIGLASVASEITYIVQERFDFLDAPIQRITTADTPAPILQYC
jgi:pyruvate dehydrogenase E1 component beta subunit